MGSKIYITLAVIATFLTISLLSPKVCSAENGFENRESIEVKLTNFVEHTDLGPDMKELLLTSITPEFILTVENITENESEMFVQLVTHVFEQMGAGEEYQVEEWIQNHVIRIRELDVEGIVKYLGENMFSTAPSPDLGTYHTYDELQQELEQLNAEFPSLMDLVSIGKSHEDRDIWLARITNENDSSEKPAVLFVGEHHAREAITVEACLRFIRCLLENYGSDSLVTNAVNKEVVLIVPMLNPDGLEAINDDPGKDWKRKNNRLDDDADGEIDEDWVNLPNMPGAGEDDDGDGRIDEDPPLYGARWYFSGGVDLNRNYSFHWGVDVDPSTNSDTSENAWDGTYRGPFAFSEPETQTIQSLAQQYDIKYAMSFHSGTEKIIYPWGYSSEPPLHQELYKTICEQIENETGYPYVQGYYFGYPTSGAFDDYMYGVHDTVAFDTEIYVEEGSSSFWEFFNPLENEISIYTSKCLPMLRILLARNLPLMCEVDDAEPYTGQQIEFSGRLTDVFARQGIENMVVRLYAGDAPTGDYATTDENGYYSIQVSAPLTPGQYVYHAHFAGDDIYGENQSPDVIIRVVPMPVLEVTKSVSLPSEDNWIYVNENATITVTVSNAGNVLAFNTYASDSIPTGLENIWGTTSAQDNLWGLALPPNVDVYVRDTNTWINSFEAEWCIVTQLGDNTWEFSFEDMKGLPSSDNDFGQPLLRVQKEDNQYLATLENYGGDFHSDIYVGGVLLWSNAGGGEDENWGVGETRTAPPLDLKLYVRDTGQWVESHEAQWCKFRLIEQGGWLYRFEDLKEQSLSLEPSGIYDFNQPILLVEKVDGNYEVTIEAYESAYHSDIWVEGTELWTGAGGPDRTHVGETKSVSIVNTPPQVNIIVQETGENVEYTESDWCKFTPLEAGSWLYLFEDLKCQPVEPDYDYNQPILIVHRVNDQYAVTLEEYKSAYHGDIYAGDNLLWENAGGEDRACVGDNKSVRNPYPSSLSYSYVVQGNQAGDYTITTTATCQDRLGHTHTASASVSIEVREQGDAGSKGDAGNTLGEARRISTGSHEGYLGPADDTDFYENWVSGSMLRVSMAPPEGADFDLYLYDPAQNLIASSENRGSTSEEAIHVVRVSGYYYIEIRKYSGLGHYTFTVEVDDTPPTSNVDQISRYWHNTLPLTVTAQASDDLSGVESVELWYQYSADDVTWGLGELFGVDTEAPWSWLFTTNDDGHYKFYTIATDGGANVEEAPAEADAQVGIDRVPPESSLDDIDPYWQSELPLTITAHASDDRSGVEEVLLCYKYSADGANWGDWQLYGVDSDSSDNWSWEFTAPENDGYYEFGTLAIDRAGNCELGTAEEITLDGEFRGEYWYRFQQERGDWTWTEIEGENMYGLEEDGADQLWVLVYPSPLTSGEETAAWVGVMVDEPTVEWVEVVDTFYDSEADRWITYRYWEARFGPVTMESVAPVQKWNVFVDEISGEAEDPNDEDGPVKPPEYPEGPEPPEPPTIVSKPYEGTATASVRITWPEATASALILRQIEFEETSEDTIPANRPIYYGFTVNTPPISLALDWDDGDLDLHLYDPEGKHVGWNYETNELELEVSGAEYSSRDAKPERIQVTDPQSGLWMVMIYPYAVEEETDYTFGVSMDVSPPESSVDLISPYWQGTESFEVSAAVSDPALVSEEIPTGVESVELWYQYRSDDLTWGGWEPYGSMSLSEGPYRVRVGVEFPEDVVWINGGVKIGGYTFWDEGATQRIFEMETPAVFSQGETIEWYIDMVVGRDGGDVEYWTGHQSLVVGDKDVEIRMVVDDLYDEEAFSYTISEFQTFRCSFTPTEGEGYYEFYTIATDQAANREEAPEAADASAGVDTTPPESWVVELADYWQNADMVPFTLSAGTFDALSGVESVELWYCYASDNSTWGSWTLHDTDDVYPWSWLFSPDYDGYYGFYSVATDAAGNSEEAPAAPPVTEGLVGEWSFEESSGTTAGDGSGYNNDGTLTNMDVSTCWVDGKVGKALRFDGEDDYVEVPYSSSLDFDELSWEAWIWIDRTGTSHGTIAKAYTVDYSGEWISAVTPESKLAFTTLTSSGRVDLVGSTVLLPENWYHVAGTYDGLTMKIYVNGIEDGSASQSGSLYIDMPLLIGRGGRVNYFDGIIDEVRVYNRALSPGEVQARYEGQPPIEADVQCGVDRVPPESSAMVDQYWQTSTPFTVTAEASDELSDVASVELFYLHSPDDSTWGDWASFDTDAQEPYSWSFDIPAGHGFYEFYSVATDVAGNVEEAPTDADASCATLIPATVDIDPDTLNLRSQGRWITTYIELPGALDVAEIDVGTVAIEGDVILEGVMSAELHPTEVGDHDGVPDLMVKFDRSAVQELVSVGDSVEITVIGRCGEAPFRGSDTIRVIDPGEGQGQSGNQGQGGQSSGQSQGNQGNPSEPSTSDDAGNQGNGQGQGPQSTPPGQGGEIPGQGQGSQQSSPDETQADNGASEQSDVQDQEPSSASSAQSGETPAQGQGNQGNQGQSQGNGQGNAKGKDK